MYNYISLQPMLYGIAGIVLMYISKHKMVSIMFSFADRFSTICVIDPLST